MSEELPSLQTGNLVLRPLQAADAPALHRIYQSDGVLRYFPNSNPPPLAKVERFIAGQQAHWAKFGYGNWGIMIRDVDEPPGEVAGWAGLQYLPELEEAEVGFLLDRPFWGKGYGTQAAMASLRFGFEGCQLDHIIALVHPENRASQRVIEKCAMAYVDSLELWGMGLQRYRINKGEFTGEISSLL